MSRIDDQTDERPKERSADSKGVTNTSEDTPREHDAVSIREEKSDARKIVTGEAKYTADYAEEFPDLAEAAVLRSEIPHGTVTEIDTTQIEEIDGVCAVLTPDSEAVPDKQYTSAGQSYPEPSPRDLRVLRKHVRYVGDPIAAVAAEDRATARAAIRQIEVTYNEQEAVFDTEAAMSDDAPQIHDPEQIENVQPGADYERNIESRMVGEIGDVEAAFEKAASRTDRTVVETEWETPRQSHCVPEPHTAIASRDEDDRYYLLTSTQVPYHIRRQLAHLFEIPIRDIRVTKPQVGAGFGSKQSMLIEPIALALTIAADRPIKLEATRKEEFHAMRLRRPAQIRLRSVVTDEGDVKAIDMSTVADAGAYGPHGMTAAGAVGKKPLPLYATTPNIRYEAKSVHTNQPVSGAMRGYGAPQGHFAVECHMDEVARKLDMDPIEFRARNHITKGDTDLAFSIFSDGDSGREIHSCGVEECIERGKDAIGWNEVEQPDERYRHRACGMALAIHGSGIPGGELGAAHIKMNEDGSFVLQTGAVDTGTGADTAMSQIAAEVLGTDPRDIVVQPSDTDISPFDYGAYASSTTYVTGQAVQRAAEDARGQLFELAAEMLEEPVSSLAARGGVIHAETSGESVTLEQIGYESIYGDEHRAQVMGEASFSTDESPPPFGAQFADVTVDERTGEFTIHELVFAVDCGLAINPDLAEGQVTGAMHMSYELATSSDLPFDTDGTPEVTGFRDYAVPRTSDQPPLRPILVETHEPTGPFGAKSIAEIPTNAVPPALSNAIRRAVGVRISDLPITPEKINSALEDE